MSAKIIPSRTAAEVALADAFAGAGSQGTSAATALRKTAFEKFAKLGLPHRRVETWHYTDLRALMRSALPTAPAPSAAALASLRDELDAAGLDGARLVIVDGHFTPSLSTRLPAGVGVRALTDVLASGDSDLLALVAGTALGIDDPVFALNGALMQDGVVIDIAPGTRVESPIHIV